ncbi:MAG: substrate-binding domain-containing protein [Acidimicrobiales bacterium]
MSTTKTARASVLAIALASIAVSGCTASGTGTPGRVAPGTANVVYAGSLVGLVETTLQPGFEKATGDSFVGKGAGSTSLAQSILNGELSPGAFVSVGAKAIEMLWPSRARYAMALGTDPLVVAYSRKSRYASQLNEIRERKRPLADLFTLFEQPGFRLGRTDPNEDPQGQFFILMCELAQRQLGLASGTAQRILGTTATNPVGASSQIFDETALDPQIAAGSLDAGSAFVSQALQYHLDYIALPPALDFADPAQKSLYATVHMSLSDGTRVSGSLITLDDTLVLPAHNEVRSASNEAADQAWLAFLLSARGRADLERAGYELGAPQLQLARGSATKGVLGKTLLAEFERLGGRVSSP